MSSCPSSELSEEDLRKAAKRKETFKKEFGRELLKSILPKMLLQDDFTAFMDVAYGIDKRSLVAESLREVAALIETKYTLRDIKEGIYD